MSRITLISIVLLSFLTLAGLLPFDALAQTGASDSPVAIVDDSWNKKAAIPPGGGMYGAAVVDGKIYAFGSYLHNLTTYYTGEKYDPETDSWVPIASMPNPKIDAAVVACQNKIYVIGGRTSYIFGGIAEDVTALNTNEVYDPTTDTWKTLASMPTARTIPSGAVVNDKIYVIGGITYGLNEASILYPCHSINETEVYDPQTDTWTSASPIPIAAPGQVSAVIDDKIYIIGGDQTPVGKIPGTSFSHLFQIYDTQTNKWSSGPSLPFATAYACVAATSGLNAPKSIYVLGGTNQVYDPKTDLWIVNKARLPSLDLIGKVWDAAAVLNDRLYLMGGIYDATIQFDEANPPPPFTSFNYEYIPYGYGTLNTIPTISSPTIFEVILMMLAVVVAVLVCLLVVSRMVKRRRKKF